MTHFSYARSSVVFQVVLGGLDVNHRWRVFSLTWKQKPFQKAAHGCGHCASPAARRRDWQKHASHKGSLTWQCPPSSPEELSGSWALLFNLTHSKLISFFQEGRGKFYHLPSFPALESQMCFPPTPQAKCLTSRRQREAQKGKWRIYHSWSGNKYGGVCVCVCYVPDSSCLAFMLAKETI